MQRGAESEKSSRERREQLNLFISIILILSGSIFDIADIYLKTDFATWTDIHCALKDIQFLGFAIMCFTLCGYSNLKIKAFTFMLIIWRATVAVINSYIPDSPIWYILAPLYATYIFWLYRALSLKDDPPIYIGNTLYNIYNYKNRTFNVLIPVNTFRGLLQALFTLKNPKYETRLLVHGDKIFSVQRDQFVWQPYDETVIQDLIEKAGARIKIIGLPKQKKLEKVLDLVGKNTIFGIRDCRRLEL